MLQIMLLYTHLFSAISRVITLFITILGLFCRRKDMSKVAKVGWLVGVYAQRFYICLFLIFFPGITNK